MSRSAMGMPRVPEPELMDDEAQAIAYARANFADVNQGFLERFLDRFDDVAGPSIVDLGCGPADIPVRLCQARPSWRVTGVDGARAMLDQGVAAVERAGLADRIQLVQAYLPTKLDGPFDAVISNSLLHHLPDPAVLWSTVREVAAPGAPIFVMDLTRPDSEEAAQALVDTYSEGEPAVLRRDFLYSLRAAFTPEEIRAQLDAAGLAQLSVEVTSDRHVTVSGHR